MVSPPLKTGWVSADAFHEQQGQQNHAYYTARVEVDGDQLRKLDTQVRLYPGMPAEVFIRTGTRTFLGYLFAPLTDSLRRAFKED
jgi:multidrug efflux pump subunit AcrA (membrane-fusion protein)